MPLREQLPDFFRPKFVGENGTVEAACAVTPVSPEYFDVYKIAVRGRKVPTKVLDITHSAPPDGTEVVISETAARRLWPSGDALGRTIETKATDTTSGKTISSRFPVVGVASDSVYEIYDSTGALKPNRAVVYFLSPPIEKNLLFGIIVVRMKGNPDAAHLLLQKTLEEMTAGETNFFISSARQELDNCLYPFRAVAAMAGFLGALAFLLTISGVFGMLSYVVTQRRKEFGIRIALGAGNARVSGMVLRQSLRLTAAGSVLGALSALAAARVLTRFTQRFDFFDAGGYAAGVLLVIVAALAASWIPASRAVNVDPARTLRCD
jgi:ABC-type antimicrobial peptide transport system permease subunit